MTAESAPTIPTQGQSGSAAGSLRIGLVTPAWPGLRRANGIATAVTHIAAGLEACGHEVTIIAGSLDAPHGNARVVPLPDRLWSILDKVRGRLDHGATINRLHGERIAAAVNSAVSQYGIEIVVMEETQGWADVVKRRVSIPVVVTLHGPWCVLKTFQSTGDPADDARREAREAAGVKRADGITAPSQDTLAATRTAWGLPDVPQAVIRNPMPLAPVDWLPDAATARRLLFVGRFDFNKGGDIVLDAFNEIARRHPTCRLTFVGPDRGILLPDGRRLTLQDALAGLQAEVRARVDVLGVCSRDEVAALRSQHGIAIIASRWENFGGTMTEAMAAGSAVVCTNVGGGAEILSHEQNALLIPPGDPLALAEACLRLMQDPALAQRLGAAARHYVANTLSPEVIGRQMAAFLALLCRR
jgi:glycosyltransferase involved in cell wall biosynthesis